MKLTAILAAAALLVLAAPAPAETYKVGPDESITAVSEIVDNLRPGDVVEITGDITDHFVLERSGTAESPIVIRSAPGQRRKIDFGGARNGIETRGDHYLIENLELAGASYRGIFQVSHDITLRNCFFHDNHNGIMGADSTRTGDLTVEFCEFARNGSGVYAHQLYLASWRPAATATVRFNYIHDSTGGANLKTRMPHNIIRYNWIENAANYEVDIVDSDTCPHAAALRPMNTEFVGNVVISDTRGNQHHQLNLGSDQPVSPGTEGTFIIANNTFVTYADKGEDYNNHVFRIGGRVKEARFHNNVFYAPALESFHILVVTDFNSENGPVGSPNRLEKLSGSNNWIQDTAENVPPQFKNTIAGADPGFVDFAAFDLRISQDSPCRDAGDVSASLAPGYSPTRGKIAPGEEIPRPPAAATSIGAFPPAP